MIENRVLFSYTFESGGSVRVIVSDDVDATKAIWVLEKLIALKEEEDAPQDDREPMTDNAVEEPAQ